MKQKWMEHKNPLDSQKEALGDAVSLQSKY